MRHRAYLAGFSQLPAEVVDEIAQYVAVRELKVLCLVSRQTGDVATRRLYHTILLNGLKGSVGCLQTLVMRKDVARCVRRLTIQLPNRKLLLGNFYQLVVGALRHTVNLTGLDISDMGRHLTSTLVDVPLPRLLELKIPYSCALMAFLRTHGKNLKVIIVQTGFLDPDAMNSNPVFAATDPSSTVAKPLTGMTFKQIETPELTAYIGPCDIIPYILPGSQVQYLTISWDCGFKRPEMERIMQSVKMSKKDVIGMDNLVVGWRPHLLEIIADTVPTIERLRLRIVCPGMDNETIDERLLSLEGNLGKMKRLQTLSLVVLFQPHKYRLRDLDSEHDFIQRLGSSIPTLTTCILPSTTKWKRFEEQYWFPIIDVNSDPLQGMKMQWFFKAFANGTYPTELFIKVSGGTEYDDVFEDLMPLRLLWDLYESEEGGEEEGEESMDGDEDEDEGEGEDEDEDEDE